MSPAFWRWRRLRDSGWRAVCAGDYRRAARLTVLEGRAWRAMPVEERQAAHDRLAGRDAERQLSLL